MGLVPKQASRELEKLIIRCRGREYGILKWKN
jgi:hypothetical protein